MRENSLCIKTCLVILCSVLFAGPLFANIIYIPSDYPTIQQGLNAAQTGDTVMVAAATYVENIVWPSRDGIRLMSEDGAPTTIIDGDAAGRVITFPNFSFTSSTVITGFTIQNGKLGSHVYGAGLYVNGSPYIFENIIQRNIASDTSSTSRIYGGGIYCNGTGTPLIVANVIRGNVVRSTIRNYGGGIYVEGGNSALILGNTIESDSAIGGYYNYGAGIYCATGSSPDIRHNVIQDNVATQGDRGYGTGIYVSTNSSSYILSNLIYNNTSQSDSWNYGAGIFINSDTEVLNNTIVGNKCFGGNWNYGAGIRIYDSTNTIGNNIIVNNSATAGGGIYAGSGDHATLLNNDVWNNTGGNYSGIAPGAADISVDPLFVTGPLGDFYLSQIAAGQGIDSPCIDYGFTTATILELDTYTTRTDSVPDAGVVDLGYHYPIEPFVSVKEQKIATQKPPIFQVFPSVSSSSCRVQLVLCLNQRVEVHIFDALGRLQQTLFSGKLIAGKHEWVWNGNTIPMGTYFFAVRVGSCETFSKKVILIR